jgi:ABC-type Mn2+/Zn2+ transport system permease subunit
VSAEPTSTAGSAALVAGFLAVVSIAGSVLALFWDPLRVSPFAVLLALIATGMAPRSSRMPLLAVGIGAICFVCGMTIAVTTNNPLY